MNLDDLENELKRQYPNVEINFWEYESEGVKRLDITFKSLTSAPKQETHTLFLSESGVVGEYHE